VIGAAPAPVYREPRVTVDDAADEQWRRVLNFCVALVGIVLTAPLMLLIAMLVRATSPGPALFRQLRVGIDRRRLRGDADRQFRLSDVGGRLFVIYKFRTMYVDGHTAQLWATDGDPRITPLGRLFRKFRVDELPQLFNVLLGDMNVVGPRPEQPEIFVTLREQIDTYAWRQEVHPGITGWAQINMGYDRDIAGARCKLELDLDYIRRKSPMHDLEIMVRTLPVMLGHRGAL
jgi:lipopolysaccharide/colanic/teichoic acid biosynthesis glycosyltransferase